MTDLATIKQGENENLSSYITRAEDIITKLEEFKTIRNSSFYVIMVLTGIHDNFDTLRTIMNLNKTPEWPDFKEQLESHAAMANFNKGTENKILNVANNKFTPIIHQNRNKQYQKFTNRTGCRRCLAKSHKTEECKSQSFCHSCGNASHNTIDCGFKQRQTSNNFWNGNTNQSSSNYENTRSYRTNTQQRGRARRPFIVANRNHTRRPSTPGRGRINNFTHNTDENNHTCNTQENDYEHFYPDNGNNQEKCETKTGNRPTINKDEHTLHKTNNIEENEIVDFNNMFL